MSRINVGTVSIGVVADAGGVGPGIDDAAKKLDKLPKAASDAEAKLERLRNGFLEVAKAANVAHAATGQFKGPTIKPVPGGTGDFFRGVGKNLNQAAGSQYVDFHLGLDALAGAKREAQDFQEAERIHKDVRNKARTLFAETARTYGVLPAGRLTPEQKVANAEDRERRRAARGRLLTGDAYGLVGADGLTTDQRADQEAERARRDRQARRQAALERFQRGRFAAAAQRRGFDALFGGGGGRGSNPGNAVYGGTGGGGPRAPFVPTGGGGGFDVGGVSGTGGVLRDAAGFFANKTLGIAAGVAGFYTGIVQHALGYALGRLMSEVAGGLTSLASQAIETTRQYEEQLVSFGVLTGSKSRGRALVGSLQQLAIETPFKSSELLDQAKLLLSYGVAVDEVKDTLARLGDVASGTGVDLNRLSLAYGQVIAKGRLQGGELRQFTEAGVGVGDFASAYNETAGKKVGVSGFLGLVEQGQVGAAVIERAFQRMTSAGGRFFGLMEARSQTVSGRIQALTESVELFTQKVGTSFFTNTGLGQFLDKLGADVRGIDVSRLDSFFRGLDRTAGPFLGRVGRGVGGLFGSPGMPDWGAVEKGLANITSKVIPDLLDGGKAVLNAFLDVSRGAILAADALLRVGEFVYRNAPSADGATTGSLIAATAGGIGGRALATRVGLGFLGRAVPVLGGAYLAYEAYNSLRGGDRGEGSGRVLPRVAGGIGRFQDGLRGANLGDRFRAGAGWDLTGTLLGQLPDGPRGRVGDFLFQADKALRDKGNLAAMATARRLTLAANDPTADDGFRGWRRPTGDAADRIRAMVANGIISPDAAGKAGVPVGGGGRFSDYFGGVGMAGGAGKPVTLTAKDVLQANDALARLRGGFDELGKKFDDLAGRAVPGFATALDEMKRGLAAPEDKPLDKFQQQMAAANFGRIKGMLGFEGGLNEDEFNRARVNAFTQLKDRFDTKLGEPPPLLHAGSQAAESAITRAINSGQDTGPTLANMLKVLEDAKKYQENTATKTKETVDALNALAKKQGFTFIGLNFGNPK